MTKGVRKRHIMRDEFGAEHIDLSQVEFTPEVLHSISAEMARQFGVILV
jgi:hypothetical protein